MIMPHVLIQMGTLAVFAIMGLRETAQFAKLIYFFIFSQATLVSCIRTCHLKYIKFICTPQIFIIFHRTNIVHKAAFHFLSFKLLTFTNFLFRMLFVVIEKCLSHVLIALHFKFCTYSFP